MVRTGGIARRFISQFVHFKKDNSLTRMYGERYYSSPVAGYPPYYESPVTYTPPPHRPYLQRYPYPPPIDPYYPPSPFYHYPSYDMRHGYRNDFEEGCLGACLGCCLAYLLCCCLTTTGDCYC